jgi:uncharacterized membrane protein YcaP (DUF421 family)
MNPSIMQTIAAITIGALAIIALLNGSEMLAVSFAVMLLFHTAARD